MHEILVILFKAKLFSKKIKRIYVFISFIVFILNELKFRWIEIGSTFVPNYNKCKCKCSGIFFHKIRKKSMLKFFCLFHFLHFYVWNLYTYTLHLRTFWLLFELVLYIKIIKKKTAEFFFRSFVILIFLLFVDKKSTFFSASSSSVQLNFFQSLYSYSKWLLSKLRY